MPNPTKKLKLTDFNTLQFEVNKFCSNADVLTRSSQGTDEPKVQQLVELSSKDIAKSNKLFVKELLKMLNPAVLKLGLCVDFDLDDGSHIEMTAFIGTKYRNQLSIRYKGKLSGAMYFKKNPFGVKATSCTHLGESEDSDEFVVAGEPQIAMVLLTKRQKIVDAFTLEMSKRTNPEGYSRKRLRMEENNEFKI